MSKHRQAGEVVRLKCCPEFLAVICIEEKVQGNWYIDWCKRECGDNDCREWSSVLTASDTEGLNKWHYHVSECQMKDPE